MTTLTIDQIRLLRSAPDAPRERARSIRRPEVLAGWATLTVLLSGAAWASLPAMDGEPGRDSDAQWRALSVQPLSRGGNTGLRMEAGDSAIPIDSAPLRAEPFVLPEPAAPAEPSLDDRPLRIRGRVGEGLYWSLRTSGASPDAAAQYLVAIATQLDVGTIARDAAFDLVLGPGAGRPLLYAGLNQVGSQPLQLVKWDEGGRSEWVDAAGASRPAPVAQGLLLPAAGHITSTFGNRYHPILHFFRFHAGLDIGAPWGSPIVAAGDGQVVAAGWASGYGREVRIAHSGGFSSTYGHMSDIAVAPGTFVHRGQLIGYVGSSGLSTGPHVHFEVRLNNVPIDPLSAKIASAAAPDPGFGARIKARLAALLRTGGPKG